MLERHQHNISVRAPKVRLSPCEKGLDRTATEAYRSLGAEDYDKDPRPTAIEAWPKVAAILSGK